MTNKKHICEALQKFRLIYRLMSMFYLSTVISNILHLGKGMHIVFYGLCKEISAGLGENQGSQLLHRMDFPGYYVCIHSCKDARQGLKSRIRHRISIWRKCENVFSPQKAHQSIKVCDVTYHVSCYANSSLLEI